MSVPMIYLASPKSAILICPCSFNMMFSGFKSRCKKPKLSYSVTLSVDFSHTHNDLIEISEHLNLAESAPGWVFLARLLLTALRLSGHSL